MQQGEELLSIDVRCDRAAPILVREALRTLTGLDWVLADAMLVASELVANAVLHSGGRPDELLEIRVTRSSSYLRVAVRDSGLSGTAAAFPEPEWGAIAGYGLRVVDSLSERWGTERDHGYLVWAELALPTPAP